MNKILVLLFLSLFFLSCSSKDEFKINTSLKAQTLMHTQKLKIDENNSSFLIILAYLNPVLDERSDEEQFVLSIIPEEELEFKAYLDAEEAKITKLEADNELLKYVIKNDYTNYFKLTFALRFSSVLSVKLCFTQCFELSFQKYSRSLYYRSVEIDRQYN